MRREIMLDLFNKKKYGMETIVRKKSKNVVKTRNVITTYENKIHIYKLFIMQLKCLNKSIEKSDNGK